MAQALKEESEGGERVVLERDRGRTYMASRMSDGWGCVRWLSESREGAATTTGDQAQDRRQEGPTGIRMTWRGRE